jgi:predicted AAA+ superfamily ATPase
LRGFPETARLCDLTVGRSDCKDRPRSAAPWRDGVRELATHFARLALFETWVVAELAKQSLNHGEDPRLFFWRDNVGTEVDVIAERGGKLAPIEIKSGMTVAADAFRNLGLFGKYASDRAHGAQLVYGGEESYVRGGVRVTAWRDLRRGAPRRRLPSARPRRRTGSAAR